MTSERKYPACFVANMQNLACLGQKVPNHPSRKNLPIDAPSPHTLSIHLLSAHRKMPAMPPRFTALGVAAGAAFVLRAADAKCSTQ